MDLDYLDFEFYYKGAQSIWDFKYENIDDKLERIDWGTCWNGYIKFNNEKRYFRKKEFWYIVRAITKILGEREVFIKLSLTCKTKSPIKFKNQLP